MAITVRQDANKIIIGGESGGFPTLGENIVTLGNSINVIQEPVEGGGTGTSDHNVLTNRSISNQHPTSAISNLDTELDKIDVVYPLTQSFNGLTIPFTNTDLVLNNYQVTSDLVVTPNLSGVINNASTSVNFIGDGAHALDLTAFIDIDEASTTFDNILNTYNPVIFVHSLGKFYRKHLPTYVQTVDTTPPLFLSAAVSNSVKNRIVLTYNENLNTGSIPAIADFTVSGSKTITSVTVSGSTVNINVNSNYAHGDSITFTYTAGSNPIQDVAGNNASNLSTTSVTNNISAPDIVAPVLQTATVESANPDRIILTYNETLDNTSVPATTDYTPSGGKTVTNVSVSGAVVTVTVNSNYISSDTITIGYTSGTNPIRDMALNIVSNLIGQSVTNNTAVAAPTVVSAATSTDGLTVSIVYSKTMPESPTYSGLSFSPSKTITSATRNGGNTSQVDYVVSVAFANGDTITASYTIGNIISNDGGVLQNFMGQSVTNNVASNDKLTLSSLTGSLSYDAGTGILSGIGTSSPARAAFTDEITDGHGFYFIMDNNQGAMIIGLSNTTTLKAYTDASFSGCYHNTTTFAYINKGVAGTSAGWGVGNWARVIMQGSNLLIQYSTNAGTDWITTQTVTSVPATMYVNVDVLSVSATKAMRIYKF